MIRVSPRLFSALLAALLLAFTRAGLADQPTARWIHVQYDPMRQFNVQCASSYLCEIALEPGERINEGFTPDPADWTSHTGYSGITVVTPHLVLRPRRPGLKENLIVYTSRRVYHLYVESVPGDVPTYVTFHYEHERWLAERVAEANRPRPSSAPTPFDAARACVQEPFAYTANGPQQWRPIRVCTDHAHTFFQLASSLATPTDVPIPYAHIDGRDQIVNWTYDAPNRLYRVDGVFDDIVVQIAHRERLEITRHALPPRPIPPRVAVVKATPEPKHGR